MNTDKLKSIYSTAADKAAKQPQRRTKALQDKITEIAKQRVALENEQRGALVGLLQKDTDKALETAYNIDQQLVAMARHEQWLRDGIVSLRRQLDSLRNPEHLFKKIDKSLAELVRIKARLEKPAPARYSLGQMVKKELALIDKHGDDLLNQATHLNFPMQDMQAEYDSFRDALQAEYGEYLPTPQMIADHAKHMQPESAGGWQ